ncbi:MAG: hypothetical protein QNI97_19920 [Desulfobacterales bacterium]|nr:hypothetical protein [Desulfobacterales bacterium]
MIHSDTIRRLRRLLAGAAAIVMLLTSVWGAVAAQTESEPAYRMDETELQSSIMSFADRLASILMTAFARYDKSGPIVKDRNEVQSIVVYALWNAYIIASESDPGIALLDMISMVTLGRIIFEDQGIKTFGPNVEPLVKGFRKAEEDIRGVAILTLDQEQLDDLMVLINRWRKANPNVTYFPFIRFSNFAAERRESKLARSEAPDGLIDSVEAVTQQAEEMRLLAERGLYLGTRMPQLASLFAELWSARLANEITTERQNAIMQLIDVFKAERQAAIDDFMAGVAVERRNTIAQLKKALQAERQAAITDFMADITVERQKAVEQMGNVLKSERQATVDDFMARQILITQDALVQLNQTGEALVDRALTRVTILVALFLVGLTLANILVGVILLRKARDRRPPA